MITLEMYVGGIISVAYVTGVVVALNGRTTSYECDDDFEVHSKTRETTTEDVWYCLLWPLFGLVIVLKAFLFILNELIAFLWLLVGVKYKLTRLYKLIKKLTDFN